MTAAPESVALAMSAAEAASDKLATDVIAIDVSEQLALADIFLICSAQTERQVSAIVTGIEERLAMAGVKPSRREGDQDNRWVLLDYLDLVVHVQTDEQRDYYSLERLWKDCPLLPLPGVDPGIAVAGGRS